MVTADSVGAPFEGRSLPRAAFAGDDGRADARLARSLTRWTTDPTVEGEVVAALASARVFVPVVALADEDAHVAVLTVTGADGRRALPVFTTPEALTRWRSDARPVPVTGQRAALSAVAEGCELLDLDPAGPVPYLVRRPAVWSVGRGFTWIPSYADPLVAQEISALSAGEGLEGRAEPGDSAELRVVLGVTEGLGVDEVQLIVGRFELALSRSERIAESVDSLEVVVRPLGQRPHHRDD